MKTPNLTTEQKFQPIDHTVLDIFPTSLLRGGLRLDHKRVAKDCWSLIEKIKEKVSDPKQYYTTYFHKEFNDELTKFAWYQPFANQIKDTYIRMIQTEYDRNVSHLSRHDIHLYTWASVWEKGIDHKYHNHQDCYISGTYYPMNQGGQGIKFQSPQIQSQFMQTTGPKGNPQKSQHPNAFYIGTRGSQQELIFQPIDGEVLMWPSNLMHMVDEQDGDYTRVAISFNLKHNDILDNTDDGEDMSYEFLQY